MRKEGLTLNYEAGGTINPHRIVKFGSGDGVVVQAAASTDLSIGVTGKFKGTVASGERIDVIRDDIAEVEYGDTVTRGQALTSDANGKAVPAVPGALKQTIIAGGAAGNHTVTGIATTDTLVSVLRVDATDVSEAFADDTAEYTISATNTINNTSGTASSGGALIVTYRKPPTRVIGYAEVSGVVGDIGSVMIGPGAV